MTYFIAAFAFFAMPFPVTSAQAGSLAERAGLANDLFDAGKAVRMDKFAMDQDIPKVPDTVVVETPAQPEAETMAEMRLALLDFRKKYGGKILATPGVLGVLVGEDCGIKFPHVHIRPHMPALVIKLDGKFPQEQIRTHLLSRIPELSKVKFRFERGDLRTAEPDELRNWLIERPKGFAPMRF